MRANELVKPAGTRVVVTGECKSKGRKGTITDFSGLGGLYSVHLDPTPDKRGCGIRINYRNLEVEV